MNDGCFQPGMSCIALILGCSERQNVFKRRYIEIDDGERANKP
jgi:hypothetical protein